MKSLHWTTAVLVLLLGTPAAADPLVVTSGFVNLTDEPGLFHVAGSGFDVSFGWFPAEGWGGPCISGCLPGTVVNMAATYHFLDQGPPFESGVGGLVNGVEYPRLFSAGEITFDGGVFAAPSSNDHPNLVFPFVFHGNVMLFTDEAHSTPPVFSGQLIGGGTVGVSGFVPEPSPIFFLEDAVYLFAPTPEPSTMALLVSGLVGAAGLKRRRARSDRG